MQVGTMQSRGAVIKATPLQRAGAEFMLFFSKNAHTLGRIAGPPLWEEKAGERAAEKLYGLAVGIGKARTPRQKRIAEAAFEKLLELGRFYSAPYCLKSSVEALMNNREVPLEMRKRVLAMYAGTGQKLPIARHVRAMSAWIGWKPGAEWAHVGYVPPTPEEIERFDGYRKYLRLIPAGEANPHEGQALRVGLDAHRWEMLELACNALERL